MDIEKKLDEIFALLKSIESRLPQNEQLDRKSIQKYDQYPKMRHPTPDQLNNKRVVEFANRQDRKHFIKACRNYVLRISAIENGNVYENLLFEPQSLEWFAKFKSPNSIFYQRLKKETEAFKAVVQKEANKLIEKLKKR